jgi:hypothetical protein
MPNTFQGIPIMGWAIDSVDELKTIVERNNGVGSFENDMSSYRSRSLDDINRLFNEASYKLNLGGDKDKLKLISTDKPNGVFNFALASPTLYRLQEYYSEELAQEQPDKFKDYNTVSGIVPPDLVRRVNINGVDTYIYTDPLIQKDYYCKKQQKGYQEIEDKVPNARLKFASKTKKVYQTYRKKGGKVKYVEIYSLTYYTSLSGDVQYAVRHLPAYMLAEYLESIGIKTRVYVTRFVKVGSNRSNYRLADKYNGQILPMSQTNLGRVFDYFLVVQPVIVKDFQQDIDRNLFFAVGSDSIQNFISSAVQNTYDNELVGRHPSVYGDPDWSQNDYWEGVERYRTKYEEYVKLGFFQSKEVLPEAMVFFHDMSIKKHFSSFCSEVRRLLSNSNDSQNLLDLNVNQFFTWWMKISGNKIKHKINIMNSNAFRKDVDDMRKDLEDANDELQNMINTATSPSWADLYRKYADYIYDSLQIKDRPDKLWFYIQEITRELNYFAVGDFYETPAERKEKTFENLKFILTEVKKVIN